LGSRWPSAETVSNCRGRGKAIPVGCRTNYANAGDAVVSALAVEELKPCSVCPPIIENAYRKPTKPPGAQPKVPQLAYPAAKSSP
jgi:hypothetical protein